MSKCMCNISITKYIKQKKLKFEAKIKIGQVEIPKTTKMALKTFLFKKGRIISFKTFSRLCFLYVKFIIIFQLFVNKNLHSLQ